MTRRRLPTVRRMLRRPLAVASAAYLAVVVVAAIGAPLLAPYGATETDLADTLSGPTWAHPLGTDLLGRDVLSRLMYGGQLSLVGCLIAVATVLVLGVTVGLVAGYAGGWADRASSAVIDLMLALPGIVILLVVLATFGPNNVAAMITVGVISFPHIARVVRAATLAVRKELYVSAARVAGLGDVRILAGQILPNITGPILVQASLAAGAALIVQSGLSYLGLVAEPPTPTWGGMVAEGSVVIARQPWLILPAGAVIGLATLAFGLLGDAFRDARADGMSRAADRRPSRPRSEPATIATPSSRPAHGGLSVDGLTVDLPGDEPVLDDVTLHIEPGEMVGLLGESGSGKSMTGRAILGLLPAGGRTVSGRVRLDDLELTSLAPGAWRDVRGKRVALVAQEPLTALDPLFRVGDQVGEFVRRHGTRGGRAVRARTLELLRAVRLPEPETAARRYPHELSGGMAQRVAIAIALAGEPDLLIADEPTTALDVTVQARILDLLRDLRRETGMAVLLISHDWGVISQVCDRAYVMYAGQVVEAADVADLVAAPRHPYTAALLAATPALATPRTFLPVIPGTVPSAREWPHGCRFAERCALADARCSAPVPLAPVGAGRSSRCVRPERVGRPGAPAEEVTDELARRA